MGAENDHLDVEIVEQTSKAGDAVEELAGRLEGFAQSLVSVRNNVLEVAVIKNIVEVNASNTIAEVESIAPDKSPTERSEQRAAGRGNKGGTSLFKRLAAEFSRIKGYAGKLWESVETSMGYVETLNYFNEVFGQIGESVSDQWESAGYDSADAYYKSFGHRAKELNAKMSGFAVNENGTLTATGRSSLGIDPEKMMGYQATFGQMASSMGMDAEISLNLSQALTEIGTDLASAKNLDFEKVWDDLASGLAGVSGALDQYGVSIQNANLQQKLNELGIQANVTALNRSDQALLRAVVLLDETRYAWGNLADAINQPESQLRLIQSNFQGLSRIIGNLFLPTVGKVLPYVNAMVIALQSLASWAGNLLGIDLSGVTSATANSNFDFGSIADEADTATEAVNKLQKGIRKFDELNVISATSGSTSGVSGGNLSSGLFDAAFSESFGEYQKAWDESFSNMENRAQEIATRIEETFAPVKKIFNDLFVGDFFAAGQDTSNLVVGILNWFSDGIDNVPWNEIGQKIGEYLAGIEWKEVFLAVGNFIETAIDAAIDLWAGSFEAAPIETAIITAFGIMRFTKLGKIIAPKITKALAGTSFIAEISMAWKSLGGLGGILTTDLATIAGAGTLTEIGLTVGTGIIGGIIAAFVGSEIGKKIGGWIFPDDKEYYDNFTWFGEDGFFKTIFADWKTSLEGLYNMMNDYDPKGGVVSAIKGGAISVLTKVVLGPFGNLVDVIGTLASIPDMFNDAKDAVANWFGENVEPWLSRDTWLDLGEGIKMSLSEKWTEFTEYWKTSGVYNWFTNDVAPWLSREKWDEILSAIPDSFKKVFGDAVEGVKTILQPFLTWIEDIFGYVSDGVSDVKKVSTNPGKTSFKRTGIPQFETGGYVPTRFSMFMAGENGVPEIMGTVGGKTAVAGGAEITGIKDAVFSTAQQEIELLRQQNQLLQAISQKEYGITKDDIGRSARQYAQEYYCRTGAPAYL